MDYDLIIVGGGLAGSALGKVMAECGARVLTAERTTAFRDRVRGEGMHPWGVAETRELGLYKPLLSTCARELRWWNSYTGSELQDQRDLIETTPYEVGEMVFSHPEMQETLLALARQEGVEVRRGATVVDVIPGKRPAAVVRTDGETETVQARLVVGADGRGSRTRTRAGFRIQQDPERLAVCGLLLQETHVPDDGVLWLPRFEAGRAVVMFPLGDGRCRVYFIYRKQNGDRLGLTGPRRIDDFLAACHTCGIPESWLAGSQAAGPLAEFEGADVWVTHPYREGVALIGDAAATSDPTWGCGLSSALKDVRTLRDQLLSHEDWDAAAHAYAELHDRAYGVLHRIEDWYTQLMFAVGPEADERRARAFSRQRMDIPDIVGLGPESPHDEGARRRFFGEE